MKHLCKNSCVPICGFCYNYTNGECKYTKEIKNKWDECDIDMFYCFTLRKDYKPDEYLNIDYIRNLYLKGE